MNNDTIVDEQMLEILHDKANSRTVTIPKMFYFSNPNTIWYAGGEIDFKLGIIRHIGLDKEDDTNYSAERTCSYATGCCVMIHKDVFKKVGFLDESYFMYGEDADYSIRLIKSGIDILLLPDAKLWHKVGGVAIQVG